MLRYNSAMEPHTASSDTHMASSLVAHIVRTPGICGGKPRIAGSRLRVQDIVVWHEGHGLSPDEIVSQFPGVTLADVYAALAYYHDHREAIRQDMRDAEVFVEAFKQHYPAKILDPDAPHADARTAGAGSIYRRLNPAGRFAVRQDRDRGRRVR